MIRSCELIKPPLRAPHAARPLCPSPPELPPAESNNRVRATPSGDLASRCDSGCPSSCRSGDLPVRVAVLGDWLISRPLNRSWQEQFQSFFTFLGCPQRSSSCPPKSLPCPRVVHRRIHICRARRGCPQWLCSRSAGLASVAAMTTSLAPDLAGALAEYAAGEIDAAEFCTQFADRTVYAVRPPGRPALAAYRSGGTVAAPIFSSLAALARWCAPTAGAQDQVGGVDWFAMTGADLMTFWPPGCDLVIDPGSPHVLRHPGEFMRAEGLLTRRQHQARAR